MKKLLLLATFTAFSLFAFSQEPMRVGFSKFRIIKSDGTTSTLYNNLCHAYFLTQNGVSYMFLDNSNHTALSEIEVCKPLSKFPTSLVYTCVSMADNYKTMMTIDTREDGDYIMLSLNDDTILEYKINKIEIAAEDDAVLLKLLKRHIR